jgi:hypothetical protein
LLRLVWEAWTTCGVYGGHRPNTELFYVPVSTGAICMVTPYCGRQDSNCDFIHPFIDETYKAHEKKMHGVYRSFV